MKRIVLAALLMGPLTTAAVAQTAAPSADKSSGAPTAKSDGSAAPAPAQAAPPAPPPAAPPPKAAASEAAPASSGVTLAAKALAVKPGHYRLDPDHGKITWTVNHLGFSTFGGQFVAVAADLVIDPKDLGKTTLTATVDMSGISTGNAKLDGELKGADWFDSKAFGQASFKAKSVTATGPQTARIDGDLTLHGKTAPIVISATFNNAGVDPADKQYTLGFDAAAIIRRSTFGITKYLPLVGDNVTLHLEGEFKPVSP